MKIVIRLSARQEAKALPIILRHAPGMILKGRTYILNEETVHLLKSEGIRFTEISRGSEVVDGAISGERI